MSTLKVNKIRDTSGSTDAITFDPNGGAVLAGVTTVSTVKVGSGVTISSDGDVFTTGITTSSTVIVGSGVTISESGIEASGIGITCANINGSQIGGRRNIIINGAMNVAQRGTSSTTSGYGSVDRFRVAFSGTDEAPTHAQVDVSSGTTPYTLGFRKALKVTNGNQTSGAGASDQIDINYRIEGQDMAGSGWNYISSNSKITLSFWVKSSVAQNFYGYIRSVSGTVRSHPYETGSLTADTWTKITKTFSGDSNITINNDNSVEFNFYLVLFYGTGLTASGVSLTAWNTYDATALMPDNTSTWYTTNDATLEITGVQLEVGSQATAFEHRSFGEELLLCQRYYYKSTQYDYPVQNPIDTSKTTDVHGYLGWAFYNTTSCRSFNYENPVEMRAAPSVTFYSSGQVSSPSDGKMAIFDGSAWQNMTTNTVTSNTRRIGIKGGYTTGLASFHTYLIGGAFECNAEL